MEGILVNINKVEPNRDQPRKNFDEDALLELAESIKQFGVLQPLLVQQKDDYYEIIAGERRWRAAKLANLKEVPVIIKKLTEQEVVEISLIENPAINAPINGIIDIETIGLVLPIMSKVTIVTIIKIPISVNIHYSFEYALIY